MTGLRDDEVTPPCLENKTENTFSTQDFAISYSICRIFCSILAPLKSEKLKWQDSAIFCTILQGSSRFCKTKAMTSKIGDCNE